MTSTKIPDAWAEASDLVSGRASLSMATSSVALAVGYLLGGDMPGSAMLLLALAEKVWGDDLDLARLKQRLGVE
jgi:hypothetical protein